MEVSEDEKVVRPLYQLVVMTREEQREREKVEKVKAQKEEKSV